MAEKVSRRSPCGGGGGAGLAGGGGGWPWAAARSAPNSDQAQGQGRKPQGGAHRMLHGVRFFKPPLNGLLTRDGRNVAANVRIVELSPGTMTARTAATEDASGPRPVGRARCAALPSPAAPAGAPEPLVVNPNTGLALSGFDPVAYFTDGKPEFGRPDLEFRNDGVVWRFRNEGDRAAFADHPEVYIPRFGGYDPVAVARGEVGAGPSAVLGGDRRAALSVLQRGGARRIPRRPGRRHRARRRANGRRSRAASRASSRAHRLRFVRIAPGDEGRNAKIAGRVAELERRALRGRSRCRRRR